MLCLQHGLQRSIKYIDQHMTIDSTQKFNTKKQLHNDSMWRRCNYTMTLSDYTMTAYNCAMTGETLGLHSLTVMDTRKYKNIWFRIQFVAQRSTSRCYF